MTEQKKEEKKSISDLTTADKTSDNTAQTSNQQSDTQRESSTQDESKGEAASGSDDTAAEEAPFEHVDLSDPPPDEPEYEMIDRTGAEHSSHNTQADHKWKYPAGFGKDQGKGGRGNGGK